MHDINACRRDSFGLLQSVLMNVIGSGVNLAGILGGRRPDPEGLSQTARGKEKNEFFDLKWCVLVNSERYFCPFPRQKNVEFSA